MVAKLHQSRDFDLVRIIGYLSATAGDLPDSRVGDQMTKWVALALGALLALVGAVCIGLGYDAIQTERGGVLVIAGAVALTGGVLTFALFAVLRELRALLAVRSMQPMEGVAMMAAPPSAWISEPALKEAAASPEPLVASPTPVKLPEPPPGPPVFHEPPASESPVSAAAGKPASPEPRVWDRPSPFRSSSFGAPRSPTPLAVFAGGAAAGAVVAAATRSEPVEAVPDTAAAEPMAEPVVEEVDDHVERAIALALADETPAESPAVETTDAERSDDHSEEPAEEIQEAPPRQPRSLREALGLQELPPEETPLQEKPQEKPEDKPEEEAAKPLRRGWLCLARAGAGH